MRPVDRLGKKIAGAQIAIGDAGKHKKFDGNVKAVGTRDLWREADVSPKNQGYYYNRDAETCLETGLRLGWAMADLLKVANIDDNVGKFLGKLKEWGLEKDTLVIFMNDNGGTAGVPVVALAK